MADVQRETAAEGRLFFKFRERLLLVALGVADRLLAFSYRVRRLPNTDLWLKRAIPILIIAFLAVIATSRLMGLMSERARMEEDARQTTALLASIGTAALQGQEAAFANDDRTAPEARLRTLLPQISGSAFVLLVDAKGQIFGASAGASAYVGSRLDAFLPEMVTLRRFSDGNGIIETTFEGTHYI